MKTFHCTRNRRRGLRSALAGGVLAALAGLLLTSEAGAQGMARTGVLEIAAGNSHVIRHPVTLQRVSIADPQVADAVVVSAQELVINGKRAGTTSLVLWDNAGGREFYTVRVTPDLETLREDMAELFPDDSVDLQAAGTTLIVSGAVSDALKAEKVMSIATASVPEGVQVVDHLAVPDPGQVLLQVRFAEVSRTALERSGINLLRIVPGETSGTFTTGRPPGAAGAVSGEITSEGDGGITGTITQTLSDAVNIFLFSPDAELAVFIQALQSQGLFRSLAEPNLLAAHGQEASFLAGGEFPYPVVQGGAAAGAVTIQFREFGVRLNFKPTVTTSGNIRLHVAPEVSTLDFANGLTLSGFNIPSILSRKAETEIELRDGQTFAIAGLIDNSMIEDVDKIPVLGDIPILGSLFRSKELRQNRSELLVLVTPRLVRPTETPPPVPTGEPNEWDWEPSMREMPSDPSSSGGS